MWRKAFRRPADFLGQLVTRSKERRNAYQYDSSGHGLDTNGSNLKLVSMIDFQNID